MYTCVHSCTHVCACCGKQEEVRERLMEVSSCFLLWVPGIKHLGGKRSLLPTELHGPPFLFLSCLSLSTLHRMKVEIVDTLVPFQILEEMLSVSHSVLPFSQNLTVGLFLPPLIELRYVLLFLVSLGFLIMK